MKKKVLNILVVILTISIIIEGFICFKNVKNNKVLEDIKTVDMFDNKDKTLSIMVQDPTTFQYTEDTSRTAWPSREEYMYAGTKCTDKDGKDIGDTTQYISFKETSPNPTVAITTKKTIYCTLYFAKGRPALEVLQAQGGDYYAGGGEHTTAVEGLYRFKGTYEEVTNNYICLGSENPDICKSNPDSMYRIIGVTDGTENEILGLEKGQLKVIKATKYGEIQKWYTDGNYNVDWETTTLQLEYLNNTFYNGLNNRIKEYIQNVKWYVGDYITKNYGDGNKNDYKEKISVNHRIGLMYADDYYNSSNYAKDTNSWLHICHGLNQYSPSCSYDANYYEWTMTRSGTGVPPQAWMIKNGSDGLSRTYISNAYSIRPVFYLSNIIGLIGDGTENIPYTITTIK